MAVVIETTLGDLTVDLYLEQRPVTCLNFLKLCKMKYYNFNLFHTIRSGFIAQTGDPTGEGSGGESIWGLIEGPDKRFFSGEKMPKIRHTDAGLLAMVCAGDMMVGSQFYFTLAADLDSLDGVHCIIGEVTEGREILSKLNEVICDETHRPYQDVRITHTVVLEDPFNDPPRLIPPSRSPSPSEERLRGGRIAPDEEIDETQGKSAEEIQEMIEEKEAKARATILEIVGDLPDADIAPPENVLFVCKLNPVTTDEDLEIIFSRFGKIVSCEVIRDKKSGDSLQYAFIEFADTQSCEDAYLKMDNVLIDDRRIHVDFSQSVSKMKWLGKGRGVKYLNDDESRSDYKEKQTRSRSRERNRNRSSNFDKEKDRNSYNNDREKQRSNNNHNREEYRSSNNSDRSHDRVRRHSDERDVSNYRQHRSRSRSRSRTKHYKMLPLRLQRNKDYSDHHNSSRNERSSNSHRNDKSNNHSHFQDRNYKQIRREYSRSPEREQRSRHDKTKHNSKHENEDNSNKLKRKLPETKTSSGWDKKSKYKEINSRTPSPVPEKKPAKYQKEQKEKRISKRNDKKTKKIKRKRKPSTSTDSDSSDTGSSTSSNDSDTKKKSLKKKKRKVSTSTSSSSNSSDSSSSSTTASSSDTSSSSSDHKKKKSKKKMSKM